MHKLLARLTIAVGLSLITAHAAHAACTKPTFSAAQKKVIPTGGGNMALFDAAVRDLVNLERCKRGRKLLQSSPGLMAAATGHSKWMAAKQKLTHRSTAPGRQRMAARIKAEGVKYRTAAENIAYFDRYQLGTEVFLVKSAANCRFTTKGGARIPPHSYASLAQAVVAGWMKSSGHKKNILNGRMKLIGSGFSLDRKAPHCGRYYITQDFAG